LQIVVFTLQFKNGVWKEYKHNCNSEEIDAVIESTTARTFEGRYRAVNHADYVAAVNYLFTVTHSGDGNPVDGDTLVLDVQGDEDLVPAAGHFEYALKHA